MRYVLWDVEPSFGSNPSWVGDLNAVPDSTTLNQYVLKNVISYSIVPARNYVFEDVIGTRPSVAGAPTSKTVTGTVEALYTDSHKDVLFKAVLGSSSSPYEIADRPRSLWFAVWDSGAGVKKQVHGAIPSRLRMRLESDNVMRWDLDVIGKTEEEYTAEFTDGNTTQTIHPTELVAPPVAFWKVLVSDGTDTIDARSFELTIDNKVDERAFILGSDTLYQIVVGNPEIRATLDLINPPDAFIENMMNGTEMTVLLKKEGANFIEMTGYVTGVGRELSGAEPLRPSAELRITSIKVY